MRFLRPTHHFRRQKISSDTRNQRREPPLSRAQLARVEAIDEETGNITCVWLTASDLGSSQFTCRVNQPFTSETGSHFFGGMPEPGDVVFVDAVYQHRGQLGNAKTQYRYVVTGVDRQLPVNVRTGRNELLRAGDKYIRSSGGAEAKFDNTGTVRVASGFRAPAEQAYRQQIEERGNGFDHSVPYFKDHFTIWGDQEPGQNQPLRTAQSEASSVLVQWGLANRIRGYSLERVFERTLGDQGFDEFRVALQDDDRRSDKSTLFLGPGFDSEGVEIKTANTNGLAQGGFRFNRDEELFPQTPQFLFDEFGRFELQDSFGSSIFSDRTGLTLKSTTGMEFESSDQFDFSTTGRFRIRARTGSFVYSNLDRTVGGDTYFETINAEHQIVRQDTFSDTASSIGESTPSYQWEIDPSPVARMRMEIDKIELGNDTSTSNLVLETAKATLGKDSHVGQLISEPAEFNIGGSSAQVPMTMITSEVAFGTGTVDVTLALARNTIEHAIANVINAAQNFFGTDYLNVSQPMVRGTALVTFLSTLMGSIISIGSASSAVATGLGTHTHFVTAPAAPTSPSADGAIIGGTAAAAINSALGSISGQIGALPTPGNVISAFNFTG